MAYANGSAATVDDLLEAIENFAIAGGWTIAKRAANLLFLEKGICKVTMTRHTYTYTDRDGGGSVSKTDYSIGAALCTSINTALNTLDDHPGSLVTSETDSDSVHCNHLFDGVAEYHLFSGDTGAGDPDYIHCALRINATDWRHFSFGLVEQGLLTHSGAAFLIGNGGYFYAHMAPATNNSLYYNRPSQAPIPFGRHSNVTIRGCGVNVYAPDALPNVAGWASMLSGLSAGTQVADTILPYSQPNVSWPGSGDTAQEGFVGMLQGAPQSQWGGNVALFTPPVLIFSTTLGRACYIGDFPGVRLLNMEGMQPGDEITLGGDTWFVCPTGRQQPWSTQADLGYQYSTGHYAVAYKKIV